MQQDVSFLLPTAAVRDADYCLQLLTRLRSLRLGPPLRVRLMSLFCKSVAAANIFPGALEVRALPPALMCISEWPTEPFHSLLRLSVSIVIALPC